MEQNPYENERLTKRIQEKSLEILIQTADILEKNEIPFFLACGTALGCVRHGGFIPWDDDVDIYIFGKDYPRVKSVFQEQDTGNLILQDWELQENYPYFWPKIMAQDTVLVEKSLEHLNYQGHVFIDVFPLAQVSDNRILQRFQELDRYCLYVLLRAYYFNFTSLPRRVFSSLVRRLCKPEKLQKALYGHYLQNSNGHYVADAGAFRSRALLKKAWFAEAKQNDFEGAAMPVPTGVEEYLTHYYGDYMQLPPENQRVSNHDFFQIEFL